MAKSIEAFQSVFDGFKSADSFFSDQVKTIRFGIVSGGTLNPSTGVVTGATTTSYTAEGFTRAVADKEFREVLAGDKVFTCKQVDLNYTPKINDKCTIEGTEHTVVEVMDGGSVVWKIQVRS